MRDERGAQVKKKAQQQFSRRAGVLSREYRGVPYLLALKIYKEGRKAADRHFKQYPDDLPRSPQCD